MQTTLARPTTTTRWVGVGASVSTDSAVAATEAVRAAVDGRAPALVLLFSAPFHDLAVLARTVQDEIPAGVPVIGCTTSGELVGVEAGSGRLVAVALGGPGLTVQTAVGMIADGPRAAGKAAAQAVVGIDRPHRALLLLTEGLTGARAELVRGAYSVAGADVALVGGSAGDELAMRQTHQFFHGEVLTGAVVGAAIGSDAPIGVGIGHGWRRAGEPIVVTESDGERIFQLDDQPALDYYLRRCGVDPADFHHVDSAWRDATEWRPLGLPRPGGEEVRAVLGADFDDRSLLCGDTPQGTVIWVMEGDAESVMDGTRTACDEALAGLHGAPPVGIIAFDCAARRAVLGEDGIAAEVRLIAECAPGVPLGGFYTYGEIARTRGSRGVHNATLVLLALA